MSNSSSISRPRNWLILMFGLAVVVLPGFVFSQTNPSVSNRTFLRFGIQKGVFLGKQGDFFNSVDEYGNRFHHTTAYNLEYGWQMMGGQPWHQLNKFPRMGIGFHYLTISDRSELGNPFSVYGFYYGNYFRRKKFEINSKMAFGLAYTPAHFNPEDEFPNDVFGSELNAFIELGLGLSFRLYEGVFLEPGVRLTHLSNGNTHEPQVGMNIVSYNLGLRSYFGGSPYPNIKLPEQKCEHKNEALIFLALSTRQIEFRTHSPEFRTNTFGMNFLMANLYLGYNHEMSRRFKLGAGLDLVYDGTNGQQELVWDGLPDKSGVAFQDKTGVAIFASGEGVIDRLSVVGALGYIVVRTDFESSSPPFEQRLGFKYHFLPNSFVGINVRAYQFRSAKAIEFNIGTRRYF